MGNRLELHEILCDILGTRHVYFQPPESLRMEYPAIVYELEDIFGPHANDRRYINHRRYQVKYISRNPDNTIVDSLLLLPYSSYDRRFAADDLYHDCIDLYY